MTNSAPGPPDGVFLQPGGALRGALWEELSKQLVSRDEVIAGTRLGPYLVVKELAHGGMGAVYLAERADGQFEQRVALKILRRGMEIDPIVRRFEQERQILASLNHPAIARLLDGGATSDGRPYFVMELVDGVPIDRYCSERRLSIEQRLRLFRTVADAVQHAHRNLVVHRDLKPPNIFVTAEGEVKLLDFGIAKLLDAGPSSTATTVARIMTPAYASPEQLRGEPVTTASDVYQLGLLLYELLTGLRPFRLHEQTPHALEQAICRTTPAAPSTIVAESRRQLTGDLDTIVLMALRKEPDRRYATAEQMSEDVNRHLANLPVLAQADTLRYRTGKFLRRNAHAVAALAAAICLLAVLIAYHTASLAAERDRARLEADRAAELGSLLTGACPVAAPESSASWDADAKKRLDVGAERIHRELTRRPDLQVTMLATIGDMYQHIGAYPEAQKALERAVALRRSRLSDDRAGLADALRGLALVHLHRSDAARAEPLLREALAVREKKLGPADPAVAEVLSDLGTALSTARRFGEAEEVQRRALEIRRARFGPESREAASSLWPVSETFNLRGRFADAAAAIRDQIRIYERIGGTDKPHLLNLAHAYNSLATVLAEQGMYREAEPPLLRAVEIIRRTFGERHLHTSMMLGELGRLEARLGRLAQAEQLLRRSLDATIKFFGPDHEEVAHVLGGLGYLELERGLHARAEQDLRRAVALLTSAVGPENPELVDPIDSLVRLLAQTNRAGEAASYAAQALSIRERAYGVDHPQVQARRRSLQALRAAG